MELQFSNCFNFRILMYFFCVACLQHLQILCLVRYYIIPNYEDGAALDCPDGNPAGTGQKGSAVFSGVVKAPAFRPASSDAGLDKAPAFRSVALSALAQ